ncbi:MAG TPA: hypothetical protein DCE13_01950 [Cryomorphaceae bacterium]|nr:MAG: hypothetical protein ABR98_01835 [Cryomorphaceae bacterium BACL7 MAG-120910-bin2]KRO68633.1 MAG: hypothetical protein ABR88_07610 [Cryomorphaceae bacterium BACL7 MAG-120322-bin74]KRO84102.1 MAG: hypothetical protein ABR87_06065 [Cryomorphaceae bacterium BACL7 MAG-121220-bin83]HAB31284.1 hypothetical protein [Cryomorphaceae bacterium]
MAMPTSSNRWTSLLRSAAVVLALKVAGALGGYAFVWVAVRHFGHEGYGRFELAFTFLSILAVLAKWGYDGVLLRELPGQTLQQNKSLTWGVMGFSALASAALALALFTMRGPMAMLFHTPGLEQEIAWMALALVPWTLFQVWAEHLRADHAWLGYGILQSSFILGLTALGIFLYPAMQHPAIYLVGFVWGTLLFWLPGFIQKYRRAGALDVKTAYQSMLSWRRTATAMFLTGTLFMVMSWSDTLMVGYFLDAEQVGLYRVAFKIATLITFAQFAVNAQIAPHISAAWKSNDLKELQASVYRVAWLNATLGLPAFAILMGWGDFFLGFFGEEGSEILAQVDLLRILCLGQIINALCGPVMYLLNMTGNETSARNTMAIAVVINIGANAIMIPWIGLQGAAWATSITMVLWNVWALVAVYRKTGIRTLLFWR